MKPFIICKSFHFIFYLDTFISFNMFCQLSYIINFTIMWTEKIIWFASEAFIFLYETPDQLTKSSSSSCNYNGSKG